MKGIPVKLFNEVLLKIKFGNRQAKTLNWTHLNCKANFRIPACVFNAFGDCINDFFNGGVYVSINRARDSHE